MKDIDEERHGSEAKRQKKDGGRGGQAAGNQGKRQVEEGRAAEDSRRMELWKQKQKPVSLAQGCLPGRVPGPKAEATARASATWSVREYLSAFTSRPIPLVSFSFSALPSFSFSSSSSSTTTTFRFLLFSFSTRVSSRPRGSLHRWLPPLSLAHRYAESFHANSPGTPSLTAYTRTRSSVKTVTHRWDRLKPAIERISSSLILSTTTRRKEPLFGLLPATPRFFSRNYTRSAPGPITRPFPYPCLHIAIADFLRPRLVLQPFVAARRTTRDDEDEATN